MDILAQWSSASRLNVFAVRFFKMKGAAWTAFEESRVRENEVLIIAPNSLVVSVARPLSGAFVEALTAREADRPHL
jgi:hypothetical protein